MSRYKNNDKLVTPDTELQKFCRILAEPSVAADEVPAGWFTVRQLAKQSNRDRCTVSKKMLEMVTKGRAETAKFRINTARGIYPVPHYRLTK